jgi:acyl-CoA thioesterase-1
MLTMPSSKRQANMVLAFLLCNWLLLVAATAVLAASAGQPLRIVVFGDSLVAGFQLKASDAFPAQLERALKARGHAVEVINAGVSGDTTAAGLERLRWSIPDKVDAVILELGANDALRGLDPNRAKSNLDKMIATIKGTGAEVLLAGMLAPPNMGQAYAQAFNGIYQDLATKHELILYPFFLDGIALDQRFNLSDGLHPNSKGVAEITRNILPTVERLLERIRTRQAAVSKG